MNKSQVYVHESYCTSDPYHENLTGKVIDKVTLFNGSESYGSRQLLITFTDNTFLAIGIEMDEEWVPYLENSDVNPLSVYHNGPDGYLDQNGEFVLARNLQNQVDLGIIDYDQEAVNIRMKDILQRKEDKEFATFRRQYKKFKHRIKEIEDD